MPHGRRWACTRKRRHETREAAVAHLWQIVRTRYALPDTMHVYRCGHCDGWHVGHRRGISGRRP